MNSQFESFTALEMQESSMSTTGAKDIQKLDHIYLTKNM